MRAMILAAGCGERMRPLTNTTPKPLLEVHGKPLIVHRIKALVSAGITELVINTGIMGNQIKHYLGNGETYGATIQYSPEGQYLLETAGGINKALPLLGDAPFIVTNADIFTDFDYSTLPSDPNADAYLILVDNPPHNPDGDFILQNNLIMSQGKRKLTYSGIGVYSPGLFKNSFSGDPQPLAPLLHHLARKKQLKGEIHKGIWIDVGTPEQLTKINSDT